LTDLNVASLDAKLYPRWFQAWRVVAVVFVTSVVSTIDKGIFSLLIDPVRRDLQISDVQISLLQGLSFGILYASAGVALGLTADRYSRRRLLAAGVFFWSIATVLGGLAQNFNEMFASRLLVGLGEATLGPCTVSLMADLFPPDRRGRPVSTCLMGQAVGVGLSVLLAGFIVSKLPNGLATGFPALGTLAAWRVTFMVCGAIGFVVVALILTIREPDRRGARLIPLAGSRLRAAADYFRRNWRVFLPFYLSFAVVSAGFYGMNAWSAVFIMRQFGLSAPQTGHALGLATLIAGLAGGLIAGNVVDIFGRGRGAGGKLRLLTWIPLLAAPSACAVLAPNASLAIILVSTALSAFSIYSAAFLTTLQDITPNEMRGVGASLAGLLNTIVGLTCGPLMIALATEHLYGAPNLVGWSIMTVILPVTLLGAALAVAAWRGFGRAVGKSDDFPTAALAAVARARRA
jgi:MFS family permease